jgi:hypothetical protein
MKKVMLFTLCLFILFACKKEGGGGKKLYLSKIYTNDLLSEEYTYSSDMKVIKRNYYNTNMGVSQLGQFRVYEYSDGLISKVYQYSKEGVLYDRKDISYNDAKKISRVDYYGNNSDLDNYSTFQYYNNQLTKVILYSANPVKKAGEWQYNWNADNKLVSLRRYWVSIGTMYLSDSVEFSWSNKPLPGHWQLYEQMMLEFPIDRSMECMETDSFYYYYSGGPPIISDHTFTQKTYNNKGYLTSQQYKLQVNNGLGITTTNYNLKYEYIE